MTIRQRHRHEKPWHARRAWSRLVAPVLASLLAVGCFSLSRPNAKVLAYALEAPRPAGLPARQGPSGLVLKVRPLRMGQMFDGLKLAYKTPGPTWESDYYHEFFIPPAQMITAIVEDWLRASGVAGQVAPAASTLEADCLVEGNTSELYGDYSASVAPKAVCAIELLLIDQRDPNASRILFHKTYRRVEPIAARDSQALVAGWNKALTGILTAFEADLAALRWNAPAPAKQEGAGQ
jgi:ABC-type uncharacterized transport system auxiliary subunit